MSNIVDCDHPVFTLKNTIDDAFSTMKTAFGFNLFQYLRCYKDGSMGLLTNQTSPFKLCAENPELQMTYSSFEEADQTKQSYWFMWDEALPTEPVSLVRERCGIYHGMTLVRRNADYYDMLAVGLPHAINNPGSFYLNKLQAIEQFIHSFESDNKDLLKIMKQHAIPIPIERRDENSDRICLPNGQYPIMGAIGPSYFTAQELACLRLLSRSLSLKEVAAQLDISPRSVETYMERLRHRTGLSTKQAIDTIL